jgi:hypothetical protein
MLVELRTPASSSSSSAQALYLPSFSSTWYCCCCSSSGSLSSKLQFMRCSSWYGSCVNRAPSPPTSRSHSRSYSHPMLELRLDAFPTNRLTSPWIPPCSAKTHSSLVCALRERGQRRRFAHRNSNFEDQPKRRRCRRGLGLARKILILSRTREEVMTDRVTDRQASI